MIRKENGSSLLTLLIISFVMMVVISALAYNFRVGSLTINTLVEHKKDISVHEGYFDNFIGSGDLSSDSDETIGDFRFHTGLNSITPGFDFENANIELYKADPYLISYDLTHQFYNKNTPKYSRDFIFNILPNSTMTHYEETLIPLNLPYVNTKAMNTSLITYKLGTINPTSAIYGGYIGQIDKPVFEVEPGSKDDVTAKHDHHIVICHKPDQVNKTLSVADSSWKAHKAQGAYRGPCFDTGSETFSITTYGNTLLLGFPIALSLTNYQISVGWSLKGGEWSIHLAIYDFDRVYTSSTTVSNLKNSPAQASLDLSNWQEITGLEGADGDIMLVDWYYDVANEAPKPLILEKFLRSGNYELEIYRTTYDNVDKQYSASSTDKYVTGVSDFDSSKIHISTPDSLSVLGAGVPLIFAQDDILDFNLDGDYQLGDGTGSTKATLVAEILSDPILIRKNSTQFYIIYFNNDTFYKYLYSQGVSSPTLVSSQSFAGQTIRKIIAKFGALFIVTNTNIYVEDIAGSSLISSVPATGDNYQIGRDGDGQIYALADGLQCTIDGNCSTSSRIYLDSGCSAYSGGCAAMAKLNNASSYLNIVYKNFEY